MDVTDGGVEITDPGKSLALARAGDSEAFCRLVQPLQTRLLRQAAALSNDLASAEDLVSETLLEAWKSFTRYDASCRLSTWLYAILLHRYQKSIRRARSRPIALSGLPVNQQNALSANLEILPSTEASPAEHAANRENAALIRQRLDRLSEKHRQIILLRFFESASLPDMARVLDCPEGTVKSRLHHALAALRKTEMNLSDIKGDKQI